jgi:uncharacterized protein
MLTVRRGGLREPADCFQMEYPQYDPHIANAPLSDEELLALDDLLRALPTDGAMNVEVMDGYLTALLVGPRSVDRLRTRDWLPAVWGGDGEGSAPFASNRQRKRATVLVLRQLHAIACQLRDAPAQWQPVFSVAEVEGRELADAEEWCIGFLEGVALEADAWRHCFDDAEFAPALDAFRLLGGAESELSAAEVQRLDDPVVRDELSRSVMDAVLLLRARQP